MVHSLAHTAAAYISKFEQCSVSMPQLLISVNLFNAFISPANVISFKEPDCILTTISMFYLVPRLKVTHAAINYLQLCNFDLGMTTSTCLVRLKITNLSLYLPIHPYLTEPTYCQAVSSPMLQPGFQCSLCHSFTVMGMD